MIIPIHSNLNNIQLTITTVVFYCLFNKKVFLYYVNIGDKINVN